jgi:uncharacterized protein
MRIDSLVVKVAELCNLNCTYCYFYQGEDKSFRLRPKFMSREVFVQMLTRVSEHCLAHPEVGKMSLILHGGEPLLIGANELEWQSKTARNILGDHLKDIGIQTNGTLINDDFVDVIRHNNLRVGVSIDGPASVHDEYRVDHSGRGSHATVIKGLRKLQDAGLLHSVLCVINPAVSGDSVYEYFRSLGIAQMDFLLPEVTHDTKEKLYGKFGSTPVADYLTPLFDKWYMEDDPQIAVRVFSDLLHLMMGGRGRTDVFGNPLMGCRIV